MFQRFFETLRRTGVPVSLREYLGFLEAMGVGLVPYDIEGFYHLARATMVKDERFFDRYDRAFATTFKGLEDIPDDAVLDTLEIPRDWLDAMSENHLSAAERAEIEALGGFDRLMEALRMRLDEQKERHQGGSKWIGTLGTSPFGAMGYNPEGVRVGQESARHRRAVKVWDKREFRDYDDNGALSTRTVQIALRRLRRFVREGAAQELDLERTIQATADHGMLDIVTRPERRNAVKLLLFLDVGGSMDPHVAEVEALFSAARSEFKHLQHYYFHNCPYEGLWRSNQRRWSQQTPTHQVLNTYGSDYVCVFVGDASMSPYEIAMPGGANEHWNPEAGSVWLERFADRWPRHIWINPVPEQLWRHAQSTAMVQDIFGADAMVPMTIEGLTRGFKRLSS